MLSLIFANKILSYQLKILFFSHIFTPCIRLISLKANMISNFPMHFWEIWIFKICFNKAELDKRFSSGRSREQQRSVLRGHFGARKRRRSLRYPPPKKHSNRNREMPLGTMCEHSKKNSFSVENGGTQEFSLEVAICRGKAFIGA